MGMESTALIHFFIIYMSNWAGGDRRTTGSGGSTKIY